MKPHQDVAWDVSALAFEASYIQLLDLCTALGAATSSTPKSSAGHIRDEACRPFADSRALQPAGPTSSEHLLLQSFFK